MKKNILLAGLSVILAFSVLSCSDNTDDNQPGNKVYIVKSGGQGADVTLYDTGVKEIYDLHIYRSGKHGSAVTAKVKILSQAEVDAYNQTYETNYVPLPASVYTMLNTEVAYSTKDEDVDRSIQIEFDPAAVKTVIDGNPANNYAVPVRIDDANVIFSTEKDIAFIRPSVKDPLVYMGVTGFTDYSYKPGDEVQSISMEFPIQVDFKNSWDITCNIATSQSILDEYNNAEGTFYTLLPSGCYTLENQVVIKTGENQAIAKLNVDGTKLTYGNYVLPVVLESVSKFAVDSDKDTYLIGIFLEAPVLSKNSWTVEASSVAGNESIGTADAIIDGLTSTYWHSRWGSSGTGVTNQLPYELVIDMKSEKTVTSIDLCQRESSSNKDTKTGKFYISSDNATWTSIGTFEAQKIEGMQPFGVLASTGRYIKIVIETSYRSPNASLSEVNIHGY